MDWRTFLDTVLPRTAALLVLLLIGWTWASRIGYPYDLEWMEGGMLAHAWQLLHGLPIYAEPSADFVPYVYPPGYSAVVAALGAVVGLSVQLGRVVSIVGSLAAAAGIAFFVRRIGGTYVVALASAAVFLGTYPQTGAFFDIVRPDGLFLGLLAWSFALMPVRARWAAPASGLLLVAAFLVKHNAAAFGVPLLVGFWWQGGRPAALAFAAASIVPALAAVGLLEAWTGGWFLRYLVEVPGSHPMIVPALFVDAEREWATPMPVAMGTIGAALLASGMERRGRIPAAIAAFVPVSLGMLAGAFGTYVPIMPMTGQLVVPSGIGFFALVAGAVALAVRAIGGRTTETRALPSPRLVFWVTLALVATGSCAWMRAHAGGFLNVHLPMCFATALAFGATCTWAVERWPTDRMRAAVGIALTLQLGWSISRFDRHALVPTAEDRAAGDKIVAALQNVDGDVLSPFAAWLPVYAGKPPSLHAQGLWDLELAPEFHERTRVVRKAVHEQKWAAVLLSNEKFPYGVPDTYVLDQQLIPQGDPVFMPKVGYLARPDRLMVRKDPQGGSAPRSPPEAAP